MDSESIHLSSQKSHKIFGDLNIFSVLAYCLHDFWSFNEHPLKYGGYFSVLKGQCHEDFAVLSQFCAKIITLRL